MEALGIIVHPDGIVQTELLIPPMGLNCDWRDQRQRDSIARFIGALGNLLDTLETHYNDLSKLPPSPNCDEYILRQKRKYRTPYPHQYTSVTGEIIKFKYIEQIIEGRLLFEVEELPHGDDEEAPRQARRTIIKFVQRYGRIAHEVLSQAGMAPELYGYEDLVDDWKMVAMECLPSSDWMMLEDLGREERRLYREEMEKAVSLLHSAGQIHGDIRACNILVPNSREKIMVKFLDFDESGPPETTTYPRYWNTESVQRPHDATEGLPLQFTHDTFMLNSILKGVGHKFGDGIRRAAWAK